MKIARIQQLQRLQRLHIVIGNLMVAEEVQRHGNSEQTSGQRQTAKCPYGRKHWPGEQYSSDSRGPVPNSQHKSVKYHGRQAEVICCPHHTKGSAAEMLSEATCVRADWSDLHCSLATGTSKKVFPVCRGLHLLYRWKGVHCGFSKDGKNSPGDENSERELFYDIRHIEASTYAHWTDIVISSINIYGKPNLCTYSSMHLRPSNRVISLFCSNNPE